MERLPRSAALLGYSGLLPPLGVIALELATRSAPPVENPPQLGFGLAMVALIYAALILSFLGGMWWGVAAAKVRNDRLAPWLILAVVPSLWALGAFLAGAGSAGYARAPQVIAWLLAAGLLLSLLGDLRLRAAELVPAWWMRLRVPLSVGLAVLTVIAAAFA